TRGIVASAAGSLLIAAPESISLSGTLAAHAGTGTTGAAPGGTLEIDLSRNSGSKTDFSDGGKTATYPTATRVIELSQTAAPTSTDGLAILNPNAIATSGVDALTLVADQIQ